MGRLRGLVGSALDHRSLPPLVRISAWPYLNVVSCLAYHVYRSGRKTSIINLELTRSITFVDYLWYFPLSTMLLFYVVHSGAPLFTRSAILSVSGTSISVRIEMATSRCSSTVWRHLSTTANMTRRKRGTWYPTTTAR